MAGSTPDESPSGFDALLNTSTPYAPGDEAEVRRRMAPARPQEPVANPPENESVRHGEPAELFWVPEPVEPVVPERAPLLEATVGLAAPEEFESDEREYEAVQTALRRSAEDTARLDELIAQRTISLRSEDGGVRIEASGTGAIRSVVITPEAARPAVIRGLERELVRLLNQVSTTAEEWEAAVRQRLEEQEK